MMEGERSHPSPPLEGEGTYRPAGRRRIRTRHIAILALAIATGHIIYAILRDHVIHGSPILSWLN